MLFSGNHLGFPAIPENSVRISDGGDSYSESEMFANCQRMLDVCKIRKSKPKNCEIIMTGRPANSEVRAVQKAYIDVHCKYCGYRKNVMLEDKYWATCLLEKSVSIKPRRDLPTVELPTYLDTPWLGWTALATAACRRTAAPLATPCAPARRDAPLGGWSEGGAARWKLDPMAW